MFAKPSTHKNKNTHTHAHFTPSNGARLIPGCWKNDPGTGFKNGADESCLTDAICHHLCLRAKVNETETQQNHEIHKTAPQDQYAFRQPVCARPHTHTHTHNANVQTLTHTQTHLGID